jgi:hypothetical protein
MNKCFLVVVLVIAVNTIGCERIHRVHTYQERATLRCEQTHTHEQCRVLYYPACDPSANGGQNGCHN